MPNPMALFKFDWFRLNDVEDVKIPPDRFAKIRSRVFKGLLFNITTALAGDRKKVPAALKS